MTGSPSSRIGTTSLGSLKALRILNKLMGKSTFDSKGPDSNRTTTINPIVSKSGKYRHRGKIAPLLFSYESIRYLGRNGSKSRVFTATELQLGL